MAKVKVTHHDIKSQDATQAPKREPVPPGPYRAIIMSAAQGATNATPPLAKISVEFHLLFALGEDGTDHDETHAGRRVYQDYVLEHDESRKDLSEQRRYELRMLLDACDVAFDSDGFDTDALLEKHVNIVVRHRKGRQLDEDGKYPVFTNVVKVDSAEAVDADNLI